MWGISITLLSNNIYFSQTTILQIIKNVSISSESLSLTNNYKSKANPDIIITCKD